MIADVNRMAVQNEEQPAAAQAVRLLRCTKEWFSAIANVSVAPPSRDTAGNKETCVDY